MKNHKEVLEYMQKITAKNPPAVQEFGAHCLSDTNKTPDGRLRFLVALLLSSQTQDPVTAQAVYRLDNFLATEANQTEIDNFHCKSTQDIKQHNLTFKNLKQASTQYLEKLIYPVGFYKKKAVYLKQFGDLDDVPKTVSELIKLKGIGFKMAKIATNVCWGLISGIAVDTHVQRISQKLGWAGNLQLTANPNKVMNDLEEVVPKELWGEVNETIVGFGQVFCSAMKPKCEQCELKGKECKWVQEKKKRM